tara:strand:- start:95 stop:241 length:147 start_codon:yes stop_codon:yes gene_type:complete
MLAVVAVVQLHQGMLEVLDLEEVVQETLLEQLGQVKLALLILVVAEEE